MADSFDRLKTALADRYAIEREIGAGGMATVYLAKDLKHDRDVAVKVLRPELATAVVLLAAFAAWFAASDVFAPGTSPSRVAVLPFSVRGSAEFDYLREGIVDLLSTRLDGVSDLRVSDPRATLARTAGQDANAVSPESSMGVARALGAAIVENRTE